MQNGKAFGFKLTKAGEYTGNINIPQSKKQHTIAQYENFKPLNVPLHLLFDFQHAFPNFQVSASYLDNPFHSFFARA